MKIAKCTYRDAEKLSGLIAASLPAISGKPRPNGSADIRFHNSAENLQYFFRHIISGPHAEIYIITDKGKIAGCFKLSQTAEYEDGLLTGEIEFNYILANYRNLNLGGRSLDFIENRFKDLHYDKIYTWILSENQGVRRFYEKHGYHFTGEIRKVLFENCRTQQRYEKKITSNQIIMHLKAANGEIRALDVTPAPVAANNNPLIKPGVSRIFNIALADLAGIFTTD